MTSVHVVLPDGIDDPAAPSGGNIYDRRLCDGLSAVGWSVTEVPVEGSWPRPDLTARTLLASRVAAIPDGAVVLIDGLVASAAPDVLVPEAGRLRLVALVHLPLGVPPATHGSPRDERASLTAARAVVATSEWTRRWLLENYRLDRARLHVAEPGVDAAPVATGTGAGGRLICVAAVTPGKGHDVLLGALASVVDLDWECVIAGTLGREPPFVIGLRRQAIGDGIHGRIRFVGALDHAALADAYAEADVLVLASRAETYGMVITEALARGLPCIASDVGGIPGALGRSADGGVPGLLVRPDDRAALSAALRSWLRDDDLRRCLRGRASDRRRTLTGWDITSAKVADALRAVAA